MKLSISILLQQECGGWANVLYQVLDSSQNERYDLIKKELVKKMAIKLNRREKRLKKTHFLLSGQELFDKGLSTLNDYLSDVHISRESKMEITFNEWADEIA